MKSFLRGFTMIEVSIFLAITGLLFVGVTVGVQNSITQQRKNDSVQNFLDFLQDTYSDVTNVQNTAGGRSDQAIYGKLIVFGENTDLAGNSVTDENQVYVYTVIGDIKENASGSGVLELLKELNANIVKTTEVEGETTTSFAGIAESYTTRWAAELEPACGTSACSYDDFTGMILIVRHPKSGNVYTFYSPEVININEQMASLNNKNLNPFVYGETNLWSSFSVQEIDICVNATGLDGNTARSDIRIEKGASNASGVQLVAEDESKCQL